MQMTETDVLVLGAGAAGLFCALHTGRRSRRVLVVEHADRPGKKILISGGGRCNFTNRNAGPENFLSANPHFARSALARFSPRDFLALVEQHRIPWHEKTLGQLFCDRSAHDILNMLLAECAAANVRIQLSTRVLSVAHAFVAPYRFRVETNVGLIHARSLVVATGGLSIPKLGATSFGYDLARQFGHTLIEPRPALVPFLLAPEDQARWCDLTDLSAEVIASAGSRAKTRTARSTAFREKMLITHRGLSGPTILQTSSYWTPGQPITLDLAPNHPAAATSAASKSGSNAPIFAPLAQPRASRDLAAASQALRATLPARLADRWLQIHTSGHDPHAPLSNAALAALDRDLHAWQIIPAGTEGFAKAEVTAGGINTDELDARTLESRIAPGLYFIGEVVDVTGWLGGYNFQWAWASAHAAAQSA